MSVVVETLFLSRTLRIKYGGQVGSAFLVQISDVSIILTAAHLVEGMTTGDRLAIRFKSDWAMVDVVGLSRCKSGNDVCAIRTMNSLGQGLTEEHISGDLVLGEEVAYCGFPLSLEMEGVPGSLGWPTGFVKGAVFSGALNQQSGKTDFLFDTINNRGFSGGPIIRRRNGKLGVAAIVSGYKYDAPAPIYQKSPDGKEIEVADYYVKPNSGFMIGVPIRKGIDAAKELILGS